VLDELHSARFVDQAPPEVFATLLDEGVYHSSSRPSVAAGLESERREDLIEGFALLCRERPWAWLGRTGRARRRNPIVHAPPQRLRQANPLPLRPCLECAHLTGSQSHGYEGLFGIVGGSPAGHGLCYT